MSSKAKNWLPFEEARNVVIRDAKKYGINGCKKWQDDYVNNNKIPLNIPRQPHRVYKNKGWVSWGDWLGTNTVYWGSTKWLTFNSAQSFVRKDIKKYDIKSKNDWYKKYVKKYKPDNIPADPNRKYKNKGWISWGDWLGNNNKRGGPRKYIFDENFFKKWSRDMAYILGFWFADGNIKLNRVFSICQHIRDKRLMKDILTRMHSDHPLLTCGQTSNRCPICYINISSKIIYNDIVELGGTPCKSLTVKFPIIPKKYIADFLRGNFDGDGSIYYDACNKKYMSCFTSGSKKFIYGLKSVLDRQKILGTIIVQRRKGVPIYRLQFHALHTIKLGKFLYLNVRKNILKMDRKFKKFQLAKETN